MSAATAELPQDGGSAPGVMPSRRRWWAWAAAGVLAAFAVLAVLGGLLGREPGGPASSSYATNERGVAAWAELLARDGRRVNRLRVPLQSATPPARETLVLLEPDALLPDDGRHLIQFVRSGGRLVYGSGNIPATLLALLRSPPRRREAGPQLYHPVDATAGAALGVGSVRTAGEGAWTTSDGFRASLTSPSGQALLLERSFGRGTLALLADVSPLQNRLLTSADNAQLALDIAGRAGRPVAFVESVHGYGESRGLAALPEGWRVALVGLAIAGLIWIAARARRLGPAELTAAEGPPARSAYADAVALLLRRTRDTNGVRDALEELWPKR